MVSAPDDGPKSPTTAPPPFDPEAYAQDAEASLKGTSDLRRTTQRAAPPPLNKRVRLAVPFDDLAWFQLSAEALALAERLDGTKTWLELLEGAGSVPAEFLLRAAAELHDAKALVYED